MRKSRKPSRKRKGTRIPGSDRNHPVRKSPELETAVKPQLENAAKITGKDYR